MKTLLELEIEKNALKAERQKRIDMLEKKLEEAKFLYFSIGSKTPEEQADRQKVYQEINRLDSFIASEQEAINELDNPSEKDIDSVMDKL